MTRQHFKLFTEMLKAVPSTALRLKFADALIPVCLTANERFDEEKFRTAANCQVDKDGYFVQQN